MDHHPSSRSPAVGKGAPSARRDLATQLAVMVRAFMATPERTKLFLLGGALVVVIGATAFGQIRLNAWNQPFYDALARKDVAGLWPWGAGRIVLPAREGVTFVLRHPYVPPGTLRAALAYPLPAATYADGDFVAALESGGLGHLSSSLDRSARWDRQLTDDEQQCLVFARLLLHKPRWVVIDEALDALDDDARKRVVALFNGPLAHTTIVNIGRPGGRDHFFTRVLHLIKDPKGRTFGLPRRAPVDRVVGSARGPARQSAAQARH